MCRAIGSAGEVMGGDAGSFGVEIFVMMHVGGCGEETPMVSVSQRIHG